MKGKAPEITVETAATVSEVRKWVPAWDDLLARSRCHRAFSSAAWYLACLDADPRLAPFVLIARRDGVPAGIFPLVLADGMAGFASRLADYNDVIVAPGDVIAARTLLETARDGGNRRLALNYVRPDANLVEVLEEKDPDFRFEDHVQDRAFCPYIPLPRDFETFLATRPHSQRKELRRVSRKAAEAGLQIREMEPSQLSPASLPELFLELHAARFGEVTLFTQPVFRAFVLRALPALFASGKLRVIALCNGDELLGIELLMVGVDSLCDWNGGFKSTPVKCSPGHLLILGGIRRAIETGFGEYDLLRGVEAYKARWADRRRPYARIFLPAVSDEPQTSRP